MKDTPARWRVMTLWLAGTPPPPAPALPGRVHKPLEIRGDPHGLAFNKAYPEKAAPTIGAERHQRRKGRDTERAEP